MTTRSFTSAVIPAKAGTHFRPTWVAAFAAMTRVLFVMVSLALASCLDFSTSPDEIFYLTFETLPYPSVVAGDTLRDSTGAVAVLRASAVNARGDVVSAAPMRFYAIDDTSQVLAVDSVTGRVVSESTTPRNVRIIASLAGLQSPPLTLAITKKPDSLALQVTRDTISYSFIDTTLNFSKALTANVLHHDSTTFYSGVTGWVVRYTLETALDTVSASLVDDQNKRMRDVPSGLSHSDTTLADGSVARKLRISPGLPLTEPLDSVGVLVEAKYKGVHIAGSPARVMVYVKPR